MTKQQKIILGALAGVVLIGVIIAIVVGLNREDEERNINVQAPYSQFPRGAGSADITEETPAGTGTGPEEAAPSSGGEQGQAPSTKPSQEQPAPSQTTQGNKSEEKQTETKAPAGDLNTQIEQAKEGDQPLLLDFGATWCPACKKMKPIVDDFKKKYSDRIVIIHVDVDKDSDIAEDYNIASIPTQIFYKDGEEVSRHVGIMQKEDLLKQFKEMGVDLNSKQ